MGILEVQADPTEMGFASDRLQRIGDHFGRYVDDGRLPGWHISVSRGHKVVYSETYGQRDIENSAPIEDDTVYRIFSMTKPLTSVAAMMLYEEGRFLLNQPVADFIPAFAGQQVYRSGSSTNPRTEPVASPMQVAHLLSHTSGLTYGFMHASPVDAMYREAGYEWGSPKGKDLAASVNDWAALPLEFQPGTEWNYGVSTDVLGRVVEVISGQNLAEFFQTRILDPLGMTDTAFWAKGDALDRLAALYTRNPQDGKAMRIDAMGAAATAEPTMLSGGGGLVSTAHDYDRFTQMLLGRGELDGQRLLGSRTVDYMSRNHLPGGADLSTFGRPLFAETDFDGVGFGLGFSTVTSAVESKWLRSTGEYGWGGAASTVFWVDPAEQITAQFFTQLLPSSTYRIRPELLQLVYQALVD